MSRVILFYLLQVLVSGYALARGGAPERLVGAGLLAAAVATTLLNSGVAVRYVAVELPIMIVDGTLLALLLVVAVRADRFWPLWVAALHALGVGAHLVRAFDIGVDRLAYGVLLASWSYPIIVLLAIGTVRHVARVREHGPERGWSPLVAAAPGGRQAAVPARALFDAPGRSG